MVLYADSANNSKVFFHFLVFLVGALVHTKAYERKREGPRFAIERCFLGGGSSHAHLPTAQTLASNYAYSCEKSRQNLCCFAAGDNAKGRQHRQELQPTAF